MRYPTVQFCVILAIRHSYY